MWLNRASEEGNLSASDECPSTHVAHKWTSTSSSCRKGSRPICARGGPMDPGLGGGGGPLWLLFVMAWHWV